MDKKNLNLLTIGIVISCLGGLFIILNKMAIMAAVLAVAGLILILMSLKKSKSKS